VRLQALRCPIRLHLVGSSLYAGWRSATRFHRGGIIASICYILVTHRFCGLCCNSFMKKRNNNEEVIVISNTYDEESMSNAIKHGEVR
jgi:hypothetical protein